MLYLTGDATPPPKDNCTSSSQAGNFLHIYSDSLF